MNALENGSPADAFLAAVRGDRAVDAARLLERHPDIAHDSLWAACAAGDEAEVGTRLARDPGSATREDAHRLAPLLYACAAWDAALGDALAARLTECARRLLDAGASANTMMRWGPEPENGIPALYFATSRGNVPLTRLLLERGAEPNDGESIFHAAQHDRRECLELLVGHGADPSNAHAVHGNTPLHFLMSCYDPGSPGTILSGMRWLLEHGAEPNAPSGKDQETALHAGARVPDSEPAIDLLHEFRADLGRTRGDGATPYAIAIRHGRRKTAVYLAALGAPTDLEPLDRFLDACFAGEEQTARALLAAHPDLMSTFGADERGRLASAAAENRADAVRVMLALGFDPAWESTWAGTPLHHAAWHARTGVTRMLLEHRAPVNARDREFGSSALGWLCHGSVHGHGVPDDYLTVADLLIDAGADRESAMNRWGEPAEALASAPLAQRLAERGLAPPRA